MLKRSGELCQYCVPGFAGRLNEREHKLYLEALGVVKNQLLELTDFSDQLNKVAEWHEVGGGMASSRNEVESNVTTQKPPALWKFVNRILKLELGSILLCSRIEGDGKEYAIIQQFLPQSLYAKANGEIVILSKGDDPTHLVQECVEGARHTLRFMASDTVARAQEIVWKKSGGQDMSRVVRAISEQLKEAVAEKIQTANNQSVSVLTESHRNGVRFTRRM